MDHRNGFTRGMLRAVLLGLLGVAAVLAQTDGPPAPRSFEPDTTAVGVFTGQGATEPGLECEAPPAPAALTCNGFLASSLDGTLLDVTVRVPQTAPPTAARYPLVVYVHGWGGSKNAGRQSDAELTGAGYAYLRSSTRGFGRSWGQTNFGDVDVELEDLRSMIAHVVEDDRLQVDAEAVAVMGASYGGAHSWLAAVEPVFTTRPGGKTVHIRTVVPVAAGTDLLYSLIPNGRPNEATTPAGGVKLSYLNGLFLTGLRAPSEARPYSNYPAYLFQWSAVVNGTEPDYRLPAWRPIVDGIQGYRSVYWQFAFWDRVRANAAAGLPQLPIFQIQGFTDDLFPIHESLRMLRALEAVDPNYPIASYFGDVGHPRAVNKAAEVRYVLDSILEWLDFYLKGAGTGPTLGVRAALPGPRDAPFERADVIGVSSYDDLATGRVHHRFEDANILPFNPANTGGFPWDPVVWLSAQELGLNPPAPPSDEVPGDVAVYEVPVAQLRRGANGLLFAGQPIVTFMASTTAHRVQLNVRLFDVASDGTKQLVTRGTSTLDTGNAAIPIGTVKVVIVTYGNVWQAAAVNTLRLEITNVDSPYITPSRIPSVTEISKVRVDIPIRG